MEARREGCGRPEKDGPSALVSRVSVVVTGHGFKHELPRDGVPSGAADVDDLERRSAFSESQ